MEDKFQEVIGQLSDSLGEEPEETNTDTGDESTPEPTEPETGTEVQEESPPEGTDDASQETTEEVVEEETSETETEVETETEEETEVEPPSEITLDGETVTLEQLREWKSGALRRDDYTRKTQELAAQRNYLAEERQRQTTLAADIAADQHFRELLSEHPDMLPQLLQDEASTRALLGKQQEIEDLGNNYRLFKENPELAKHFVIEPDVAQQRANQQQELENIQGIAAALDARVTELASDYPDVDPTVVQKHIIEMGGVPQEPGADIGTVIDAFGRVFAQNFVQDANGQYVVNDAFMRTKFESLQNEHRYNESQSQASVQEHNAEVDAQLSNQSDAPPVTPGGEGPSPQDLVFPDDMPLNEVLEKLGEMNVE